MLRAISLLCSVVLAAAIPTNVALAAAPTNDDFAAADLIESVPAAIAVDLTDSTFESGEDQNAFALNVPGKGSVWYEWDASPGHSITVSLLGSPGDAGFALYTEVAGAPVWTGWASDASGTVQIPAPGTIYIQVVTIYSDWAQLNVATAPANDNLADATAVSLPFEEWVDLSAASAEPEEPQGCGYYPYTVWYSYTPERDENVLVSDAGDVYPDVHIYRADEPNSCMFTVHPSSPAEARLSAGIPYLFQLASYGQGLAFISLQPGTPILEASVTWNPVSTVTKAGGVILRGEMTCNMTGGAGVNAWVRQRAGRMTLVTAYGSTELACASGSNPIAITMYGDHPFNPGSAEISWEAVVSTPDNQHEWLSGQATVRLRR